jgi:hypothetical protein
MPGLFIFGCREIAVGFRLAVELISFQDLKLHAEAIRSGPYDSTFGPDGYFEIRDKEAL